MRQTPVICTAFGISLPIILVADSFSGDLKENNGINTTVFMPNIS